VEKTQVHHNRTDSQSTVRPVVFSCALQRQERIAGGLFGFAEKESRGRKQRASHPPAASVELQRPRESERAAVSNGNLRRKAGLRTTSQTSCRLLPERGMVQRLAKLAWPAPASDKDALSLERLDRAEFFQFGFKTMAQRTFRTQFVQQPFRLRKNSFSQIFGAKQISPTSRYLLFGKQFTPRRK